MPADCRLRPCPAVGRPRLPRWGWVAAPAIGLVALAASCGAVGTEVANAGAASAQALRATTVRLLDAGPRVVGEPGHAAGRKYVGGRLLLAGLKPILTDTFTVSVAAPDAAAGHTGSARRVACGTVVAFCHGIPLADRWSDMKSEAEHFAFDRPPRPDMVAALQQAARDEGVDRLTPFDVFKRPSPLFPKAVVRCLVPRLVRQAAGAGADDPQRRAAVMAAMLRDLALGHEAVLLAAPLDMRRTSAGPGPPGADESASLAVLCAVADDVAGRIAAPRPRTLIVAALDGHFRGAAGATSLGRLLGAAGRETRRPAAGAPRATGGLPASASDTAEDAQLAALLGPSEAAARAPAAAQRLEARPEDPQTVADAEDLLVRLLRLEPYQVRTVVVLDLSSTGRRVEETVVTAGSGGGEDPTSVAAAALAAPGRPVIVLRTMDADRSRWGTAADVPARTDFDALAAQARAVADRVTRRLQGAQGAPSGSASPRG